MGYLAEAISRFAQPLIDGLAMSPTATKRPAKKYAGTGRNERCPCGSGKKYKVCCGR